MAPEMLLTWGIPYEKRKGYTAAVDWWSMGACLFALITGMRPFPGVSVEKIEELAPEALHQCNGNVADAFIRLYGHVRFDHCCEVDPTTKSFISALLNPDVQGRLGSDNGIFDLRAHEYFFNIDFDLLDRKLIEPPFIPEPFLFVDAANEDPQFSNYDQMLVKNKKYSWLAPLDDGSGDHLWQSYYSIHAPQQLVAPS